MLGYMVTWTTYGTWLQGDRRGYVKDGSVCEPNERLEIANRNLQNSESIILTKHEREVVKEVILAAAEKTGRCICAIAVCSNHVHVAARVGEDDIEKIVMQYKSLTTQELRKYGRSEKVWTKGFDKRFCFNEEKLAKWVRYVVEENRGIEIAGWK